MQTELNAAELDTSNLVNGSRHLNSISLCQVGKHDSTSNEQVPNRFLLAEQEADSNFGHK